MYIYHIYKCICAEWITVSTYIKSIPIPKFQSKTLGILFRDITNLLLLPPPIPDDSTKP